MLSFAGGKCLHGGAPVSRGVRYILAVFLYIDVSSSSQRASATELPIAKRQKIEFGQESHTFSFQF